MNNLEVFNEIRSKLNTLVETNKGLKINGVEDKEGYDKVKQAKNELRKEEIELEKLAKSERQQALEWQRGIIALEKDLKAITSPVIEDYKEQLQKVDEEKAREDRKVLLPDRKKQLEEINYSLNDEDILNYDEKQWADFYNKIKLEYLEIKDKERIEKERKEQEEKRIEEAKEKAVKEEQDRQAQKILQEEADKKAKQEEQLKDAKMKDWLKDNGVDINDIDSYVIKNKEDKLVLYKKISELTIK